MTDAAPTEALTESEREIQEAADAQRTRYADTVTDWTEVDGGEST